MPGGFDRRVLSATGFTLLALHLAAWGWLLALLPGHPALLGIGLLAYFLGLRHAFDADHIAAIDNVTRKLRQDGQRPVAVGLFFSLGHSGVVVLLSAMVALLARDAHAFMRTAGVAGGWIGTLVSAAFLTLIGLVNLALFRRLLRLLLAARRGEVVSQAAVERLLAQRGGVSRWFHAVYARIRASWQMLPLGFLFGLGFDTATEVAVLGLSAAFAQHSHFPVWGVLVFPLLFAAGMSLMDTLDGLAMLKVYDWAMQDAARKLGFNVVITGLSVLVALVIGGVEWLQWLGEHAGVTGSLWAGLESLDFSAIGLAVTALLLGTWVLAWRHYRA
ncbi:MAG: HoxN/HupN/NixA family nickel/cobalt transporter [Thiomonas sp.]|uniref:HoxN/HupN/NixA family nickel/cobalt transporter n=1 Tax=Thiomonas sp. TaxID=2047785 RepID=UPI002A35FC2C|nr:HoxN/HupN/NixA family nickel/cobalt transporter [Thiomonas sp.]MDY0329261.1 HoxN/HupN/NixA family nickel/cobalt transporter [Thiomonas sp.]